MKNLFTLILSILVFVGCQNKSTAIFNSYGEAISTEAVVELTKLNEQLADKDSVMVTLKGTIDQTCAKKGCWMSVKDDRGVATRVTFKDYGFFVPTSGAEGKDVVFSGVAKRKVTDVATLRHFAEDAGQSQQEIEAITEPKEEIEFVASGVVIYERESKE
jgi:hypothetical protein